MFTSIKNILCFVIILLSFCGDSKALKKELKECYQTLILNIIYNSNFLLDPEINGFDKGAVLAAYMRMSESCKESAGR